MYNDSRCDVQTVNCYTHRSGGGKTAPSQLRARPDCDMIWAGCWRSQSESGGLRQTVSFLQEWRWRFARSRSSKVIYVGTNRKRVCDFLLVRNSNLGPILHRFGDKGFCAPDPHFIIIFRCTRLPLSGSMWADALSYSTVKLFSK